MDNISLNFFGGVADGDNITGSSILLTIIQNGIPTKILIDAGLVQCNVKDSFKRNTDILSKLNPDELDYIILTHAHVDHVGRLPLLVKNGFKKKNAIFCTKQTTRILKVMLKDTAKIQLEIANRLNKCYKKKSSQKMDISRDQMRRGKYDKRRLKIKEQQRKENELIPKIEAVFNQEDVDMTLSLFEHEGYDYNYDGDWIKISDSIGLKFYPTAHTLGSAACIIRIETNEEPLIYGFSGDLGQPNSMILPKAVLIKESLDSFCIESTYGDQNHPSRESEVVKLFGIIRNAVKKKQKILIPSFAFQRAQEMIVLLSYHMKEGTIPRIPIYINSPMTEDITRIYKESWDNGDFSFPNELGFNPFSMDENPYLNIISEHKESHTFIESKKGPYIVIAGSGMCDHGRIRDHLRKELGKENTVICLIGYMVHNSLGRKLKNQWSRVKISNQEIVVRATIHSFDSFSSHADASFLHSYTKHIINQYSNNNDDGFQQTIFINHGELEGAKALKSAIMQNLDYPDMYNNIIIPKLHSEYTLQ